jgi:hypothetical protein
VSLLYFGKFQILVQGSLRMVSSDAEIYRSDVSLYSYITKQHFLLTCTNNLTEYSYGNRQALLVPLALIEQQKSHFFFSRPTTLHVSTQYFHVAVKPQATQEFNAICHIHIFAFRSACFVFRLLRGTQDYILITTNPSSL